MDEGHPRSGRKRGKVVGKGTSRYGKIPVSRKKPKGVANREEAQRKIGGGTTRVGDGVKRPLKEGGGNV